MTVKNLSNASFDEIVDCVLLSFENYYVKMPTEKSYYKKRWKAAKVDFHLSYGMFDQDKLVGFIIHGIDTRNGIYTAFNTGTGVLPDYRGKRIVKRIYQYALPDLIKQGIKKTSLEVIVENTKAIKAYESVGFTICKNYNCYAGAIQSKLEEIPEIKEIAATEFNWDGLKNQDSFSWDFQKESIIEGDHNYYQVFNQNILESYFIINPHNKYLVQFDLIKTEVGAWERLFRAIKKLEEEIKIINVDTRLKDKIDIINLMGLKSTVNQFEMELLLE